MQSVNQIFSNLSKILVNDKSQVFKLEEAKRRKEVNDIIRKIAEREIESKKEFSAMNQTSSVLKLKREDTFPLVSITLVTILSCSENPALQVFAAFFFGAGCGGVFAWSDVKKERSFLALDREKLIKEKIELNKKLDGFNQEQLAVKQKEHQKALKDLQDEEKRVQILKQSSKFFR